LISLIDIIGCKKLLIQVKFDDGNSGLGKWPSSRERDAQRHQSETLESSTPGEIKFHFKDQKARLFYN
jgi:hypothetical protein